MVRVREGGRVVKEGQGAESRAGPCRRAPTMAMDAPSLSRPQVLHLDLDTSARGLQGLTALRSQLWGCTSGAEGAALARLLALGPPPPVTSKVTATPLALRPLSPHLR